MDGIHDLGGKQGFGRIATQETEENFHAPWEARLYGLVRALTPLPDWSVDWFRHCRELIDPVDYLTRPYFDQWAQTYAAMMVNSGAATVAELASGMSQSPPPALRPPMPPDAVAQARRAATRHDRPGGPPRFALDDAVRARPHGVPGHTRLPAYARGRRGTIAACHGHHVLPDARALGRDRAEPIYAVVFDAAELFPEAAGRRDRIYLDLWESYLDPA